MKKIVKKDHSSMVACLGKRVACRLGQSRHAPAANPKAGKLA
jgi:hypothetical protein